jgi:Major Facilitator Superfamily.
MQQPRNFDDIKFTSIHRRIMLWGSGGPFLDGYVLVMIGVALEQLTPALKLDAQWIGLLGAGTLAGLFVGTSLFGYISDKVGRRKMFIIDIIAIGVISAATMFVSSPVELLVMRVLIGIVIGADYPIANLDDYRVLQYPPARFLHRFYRRDVVCRRHLCRSGRLLAV